MVLTKEQRVELLARAREAKARKRLQNKGEETPLPVSEVEEEAEEEEPEPEPLPTPKKKAIPLKWLKKPEPPVKVCCKEKLTKESPLIEDDESQLIDERIAIPPKSIIKKPKAIRSSGRSLDMTEPTPIEEVLEEVKNNDMKYRPQRRPVPSQPVPIPQHPIKIIRQDPPLNLFNY